MKKERGLALAACAALAALMLLFASQCSPLYPINLWDDANCLLTVGRVMRRGGVLYRDIYEQKGPLLYLIHALAACVSDTSFYGVYALEIPALTAAACAASLLLAWFATPNAFLRGQKLEQIAQGRLAAAMPEGATLLQYSHLDDGLYLAAHTLPREKYFVLLNVQLEAMRDALDRAVREAVPDYVLVSWRALPAEFDRYELIASDVGYDDDNRLNKALYLYRRKSE